MIMRWRDDLILIQLREIREDIRDLRGEIKDLRSELNGRMDKLENEMRSTARHSQIMAAVSWQSRRASSISCLLIEGG